MPILPAARSLYWNNVSPTILAGQRSVFKKLAIPLDQCLSDGMAHSDWMHQVIDLANPDEILVFCDIDAFPISKHAFEKAVACAGSGKIFGLAQTANHLPFRDSIYAGPMFLAFRKRTFLEIGSPSLQPTTEFDVAQMLTLVAIEKGVGVELTYPSCCLEPKWALSDRSVFGIGTFYGDTEFFHLFQSRQSAYIKLFDLVAQDVSTGTKLNWDQYLKAIKRPSWKQRIKRILLREIS